MKLLTDIVTLFGLIFAALMFLMMIFIVGYLFVYLIVCAIRSVIERRDRD